MQPFDGIELETAPEPRAAVIWLHGLGADAHDFAALPAQLGIATPAIRFVLPNAPVRAVTINAGMQMRAWYDIQSPAFGEVESREDFAETANTLEALIARETQRGIPARRIVLGGFSQGGASALFTGLRYSETLAGIVALSAYLPFAADTAQQIAAANQRTPIFMAHGEIDPMIPIALAERGMQTLRECGCDVTWQRHAVAHGVNMDEIAALGDFIRRCLN